VPDFQNKGDVSEEVRVSPEPGISMNPVHPILSKGKGPKTGNTLLKETNLETPMEESPRMQLSYSTKNGKDNKGEKATSTHPPTL
jgi:hypothetical protein